MSLDFSEALTEKTPRIVRAAKLLRSPARKKSSVFLIEGENSVEAALATGAAIDVFFTEDAAERFAELLTLASHMDAYIHPITAKAAKSLSDTTTPPGIFALATKKVLWRTGELLKRPPQLLAVGVETNDPGNAGVMVRLGDALGADAVIFSGERTTDPLGPKAVRASAGSLFHVPVSKDGAPTADLIARLQAKGLQVLATSGEGEVNLDEADELLSRPTAWLFGNEAHGLSPEIAALADHRVRIPIRGRAESLNLATAAAICLHASAKAHTTGQGMMSPSL